jgi:2-aminoadipate transaminase
MPIAVSDRMASLKPSAIREIFKVLQDPEVISFAAGSPAPETFPGPALGEIAAKLLRDNPAAALQYGITEGYPPLRAATADRLRERYGVTGGELIVTSGGNQAIELCAKVLLNEGDAVICEDPSFIGALNAFRSYNARLVGADMDNLEEALKNTPRVKIVYVIPTFQNPSGSTMPLGTRRKVLELCAKYGVMLLEDDPYIELRYSGDYAPPIASMDGGGDVLYVGSYSKTISPGLRVGFCHGPPELINRMITAKQTADVHTGVLNQMMVYEYVMTGALDGNIEKARSLYKTRRDLMASLLTERLGGKLSFVMPDGGLFLWASLRDGTDGMAVAKAAGRHKVAIVPGSAFSPDENTMVPAVRLNFSLPNEEQIREGARRLSLAMNEVSLL